MPAELDLCSEFVVLEGDAANEIIELAMSYESPQIVMSPSKRGRDELGPIAERVLRFAPCPVVMVSDEDVPASTLSGTKFDTFSCVFE
jgi:nucleotide-binding universal stress UspA family protein